MTENNLHAPTLRRVIEMLTEETDSVRESLSAKYIDAGPAIAKWEALRAFRERLEREAKQREGISP